MTMSAPPEVGRTEYERRLLAKLRGIDIAMGTSVADVWLEGEHPDTQLVVVVQAGGRTPGRYDYRHDLWYAGTDSNPELEAAPILTNIMESSPWGMGHGRQPGWNHEPRPPLAGATPRRPDLDAPPDTAHPAGAADRDGVRVRPWPRPAESDPDLHERCLLSVFHGEWPGFRAHIDDAWLEHEYPDTMIVLALARVTPLDAGGPGLPVQLVVYRTEVWRKLPLPPGTNTRAWSVGSIAGGLIEWCYFVKRGSLPIESHESHEIRPPKPDTARRRPRL